MKLNFSKLKLVLITLKITDPNSNLLHGLSYMLLIGAAKKSYPPKLIICKYIYMHGFPEKELPAIDYRVYVNEIILREMKVKTE